MKKIFLICTLFFFIIITGCSTNDKTNPENFINDVINHGQNQPNGENPEESITAYNKWLEETTTKFQDRCEKTGMDSLTLNAFPALQLIYDEYQMPATITKTDVEEKADSTFYATVELKDKENTTFQIKLRVQYKKDKVNFLEIITK